jgi:hypothetical protein
MRILFGFVISSIFSARTVFSESDKEHIFSVRVFALRSTLAHPAITDSVKNATAILFIIFRTSSFVVWQLCDLGEWFGGRYFPASTLKGLRSAYSAFLPVFHCCTGRKKPQTRE